jgi:hypothetical protein
MVSWGKGEGGNLAKKGVEISVGDVLVVADLRGLVGLERLRGGGIFFLVRGLGGERLAAGRCGVSLSRG